MKPPAHETHTWLTVWTMACNMFTNGRLYIYIYIYINEACALPSVSEMLAKYTYKLWKYMGHFGTTLKPSAKSPM